MIDRSASALHGLSAEETAAIGVGMKSALRSV
jgi:hypothetical protein